MCILILIVGCSSKYYQDTMTINDCYDKFVYEKGIDLNGQVYIAYPQFCCLTTDNTIKVDEIHCYLAEEVPKRE